MICEPCQMAADVQPEEGRPPHFGDYLTAALHNKCRGGTWCCCQHRVRRVRSTEELTT